MAMHKGFTHGAASAPVRKEDVTLSDYIVRKHDNPVPKKLTFEEWYMNKLAKGDYGGFYAMNRPLLKALWNDAQENK